MPVPPRNPLFAPWLDLRAYKISDPIERLRFLRREMEALESEGHSRPGHFHLSSLRKGILLSGLSVAAVLAAAWPVRMADAGVPQTKAAIQAGTSALAAAKTLPKIWRVDRSETVETYSNGLRVDLAFATSNHPRVTYPVFPLTGGAQPVRYQTMPAGIVYHTTESTLDDFDEAENRRLKFLGRSLLEVVRQEHAYHYVIDRFGRVYRVVEESDIANHSGHSIWADSTGVYVNLNDSFLAVSFEAQTGDTSAVTPAQITAARMLTEMLRARYSIPPENCITHGQVSVGDGNGSIGQHTDWGSQFPFAAVGLPDNYTQPLPSMFAFGFDYSPAFVKAVGGRWKGLDLADAQLARQAAAEGMSLARYRTILQHRYTDVLAVVTQSEGGN